MTSKYFVSCETLEQVKAEYKRLAKLLHPDCGGDAEEFKAMHDAYEAAFNRCKNYHASASGETYYRETTETPEDFAAIIEALIILPGLEIELCGRWIWIGGDTYTNRAELKKAGCKWASKKKRWYWHLPEDAVSRGGATMEEIRQKYGSQRIDSAPRLQIA